MGEANKGRRRCYTFFVTSDDRLVTSNHVSPQLRAGCLQLGADGYFDKVKELEALAERVAHLASSR